MEAGFNSDWLLPNRLYEGGYFGVPAIATAGTQTAKWIEARGAGFTVDEDLARNLPDLVRSLLQDPGLIATRRQRLLELPVDVFVARRGELDGLIGDTLRNIGEDPDPNMHQFNTRSRRNATG
jgi:succinoglycan biosynthesis protein ExoL